MNTSTKLLVFMYADDTIMFGTDEREFHKKLNAFFKY